MEAFSDGGDGPTSWLACECHRCVKICHSTHVRPISCFSPGACTYGIRKTFRLVHAMWSCASQHMRIMKTMRAERQTLRRNGNATILLCTCASMSVHPCIRPSFVMAARGRSTASY